jgi:GH25 family lysozyme M1 (1,4-beta-N-acetylmuramidase)
MTETLLAKDHDVIEAVPRDRSDQPPRVDFARGVEPIAIRPSVRQLRKHCLVACSLSILEKSFNAASGR